MHTTTRDPASDPAGAPAGTTHGPGIAQHAEGPTADSATTRSAGLLLGTGLVAVFVLAIFAVYGEVFLDAAIITAILCGVAYLAERRRLRWACWALAGLTTVFIGVNLVYALGDLAHPETWAPFTATAGLFGAAGVTVILAVRAARGKSGPPPGLWGALAGVVLAALVGSLAAAAGVVDHRVLPGDVIVAAESYTYPEAVTVDDTAEAIVIDNADRGRHTFVIDGLIGPVELPGSSQVRIPLDLEPGTYTFICDIVGHEAMQGTLTVG